MIEEPFKSHKELPMYFLHNFKCILFTGWKRNAAVNDRRLECLSRYYPCGLLCQYDACHCLAQSCEKVIACLLLAVEQYKARLFSQGFDVEVAT